MVYILDGYNIIKRIPQLELNSLKDGRSCLIRYIETKHPQGSSKNKVIFVFDGKEDVFGYKLTTPYEVIFTKNETADDWIKRKIEVSKRPNDFILVSDDKLLCLYVRSLGAKVISVADFFAKAEKKKKCNIVEHKPELDIASACAITEELRKIWLGRDEEN